MFPNSNRPGKRNEDEIVVYHYSKIPENFHNSKFVESNNLDLVIEKLKEEFQNGKTYTSKEAIDKIKLYFR